MSNFESESDRKDGRGRSEGSRRTQFATGRQPEDRRKPAGRKNLKASLLSELRRPVTLSRGGKTRKVEFLQALLYSISRDLLNASLSDRMRFVKDLDKLQLTGLLADQAKLDEERAEVQGEHRELAQARHRVSVLADGMRYTEQLWRKKWYTSGKLLTKVRDLVEWGSGTERLAEDIEIVCRAFESDVEGKAYFERVMADLPTSDELDEVENDDRDDADPHDETTDGAIEYVPSEYDENALPATHDPNDPALDLANGHIGAEDLNPPADDEEGED